MELSNRFRSKLGLSMQVCVPEILLEGSTMQILTTLESEYTKLLLETLTQRGVITPGEDTPMGEPADDNSLQEAFSKILLEPDAILSSHVFQEHFPQFIMAFYCANLPCSAKKYSTLNQMSTRAIAFLNAAA